MYQDSWLLLDLQRPMPTLSQDHYVQQGNEATFLLLERHKGVICLLFFHLIEAICNHITTQAKKS
jgi:hypothetical protein